jgi:4-amino-4-deoxy-L-arabinose transferase-like glycosyltransferase
MNKWNKNYLYLVMIIILGLSLRIFRIDQNSIWRDEAYTWHTFQFGFDNIINITRWDTHPPLHNILEFLWTRIFGESAIGIRLMSVLFGTIAIIVTYFFGYRITKNQSVSLVSTLLVAINPQLIIYSQEGRAYSLLLLLTLILFYILSQTLNYRRILYASIIILIGLYSHSLFILIAPIVVIYNILFYRDTNQIQNIKNYLFLTLLSIVGYIPYLLVISQAVKEKSEFWLKFNPYKAFQDNWGGLFTSEQLNINNYGVWFAVLIIGITSTLLFLAGLGLELKQKRIKVIIIPCLLLISIYLISFVSPLYNVRYIQHVIPFILLIVSLGISRLIQINRIIGSIIMISLVITTVLFYTLEVKSKNTNADYNTVVLELKKDNSVNIMHSNPDITYDVLRYYEVKNNYKPNNYILQYPNLTKKQFQSGIIAKSQYIQDINTLENFTLITEWTNYDAANYIKSYDFCLKNSKSVGNVGIANYVRCSNVTTI